MNDSKTMDEQAAMDAADLRVARAKALRAEGDGTNVYPEFLKFPKIPRLSRDIVATEKIDGTSAQIFIGPINLETTTLKMGGFFYPLEIVNNFEIHAGSRNRWLSLGEDNYGFAAWVTKNAEELVRELGPGRHFGEWWGLGIQRGYNQTEKRFSLFNVSRWVPLQFAVGSRFEESGQDVCPACCSVVPVLYRGPFLTDQIDIVLRDLAFSGSVAAPGFPSPEGIVIYHTASNYLFKKTIVHDACRLE